LHLGATQNDLGSMQKAKDLTIRVMRILDHEYRGRFSNETFMVYDWYTLAADYFEEIPEGIEAAEKALNLFDKEGIPFKNL